MHHGVPDSWHDPHPTEPLDVTSPRRGAPGHDDRTEGRAVYAPGQLTTERPNTTHMAEDIDEVEAPEELIEDDLDELADDEDLIAEDPLALDDDDAVAVIEVDAVVEED